MIRTISILSLVDLAMFAAAFGLSPHPALWFAPVHFVLTLLALLDWPRRLPKSKSLDFLAFPVGAAIGPLGILLLLLFKPWSLIASRIKRLTYSPLNPHRYCSPKSVTPLGILARILDERVRFPEADQIESLMTTLQHGSLSPRRRALEITVRSFEPRLSPLIATALTDKDQTIRALAAAAAAQVSYNFAQRRTELEARIALNEKQEDSYVLAMFLADHGCHNMLLSQSQRVHLCQKAAEWLKDVDRHFPAKDQRRKTASATLEEIIEEMSLLTADMPKIMPTQAVESADDRNRRA